MAVETGKNRMAQTAVRAEGNVGWTRRAFVAAAAMLAAGACWGLRPGMAGAQASAEGVLGGTVPPITVDALWGMGVQAGSRDGFVSYLASEDALPASWAYWAARIPEAWLLLDEEPGTGVVVGVVDGPVWCSRTGSDGGTLEGHEDLPFVLFSEQEDEPQGGWLEEVHGTIVAGIIAATADNGSGAYGGTVGVAHGCSLANVDYGAPGADAHVAELFEQAGLSLDDDEDVRYYDAAYRYLYALERLIVDAGARVINVSNGLSVDDVLRPAHGADSQSEEWAQARQIISGAGVAVGALLGRLLDEGYDFVICKAAGNSNSTSDAIYKEQGIEGGQDAALDILAGIEDERVARRILVVGAVAPMTPDTQQVAPYSAGGPRVDVVAPGTFVYSTTPNVFSWLSGSGFSIPFTDITVFDRDTVGNGYTSAIGTSFAAPIVSGVAALVWQANIGLTGEQVADIIRTTATKQIAYGEEDAAAITAFDGSLTYGLVDAEAAVRAAFDAQAPADKPADAGMGLPVGTFTCFSEDIGMQKTLVVDENWEASISVYGSRYGGDVSARYQVILDLTVTVPDGWSAYLLEPLQEGPGLETLGMTYNSLADTVHTTDEPSDWTRVA